MGRIAIYNLNNKGTNVRNAYKGLKDFYRTVDMVTPLELFTTGRRMEKSSDPSNVVLPVGVPEQPEGNMPPYWTDNNLDYTQLEGSYKKAGANSDTVLEIIKSEVNNNRTVIAVMQGWDIEEMSSVTTDSNFPNTTHEVEKASASKPAGDGISYYKIKSEITNETYSGETFTASDDATVTTLGVTAVGKSVLIIGYISAGSPDDVSTNKDTDWLIVRDNDEQTERNVIIPFKR